MGKRVKERKRREIQRHRKIEGEKEMGEREREIKKWGRDTDRQRETSLFLEMLY